MYRDTTSFYKSNEWETFRKIVINHRTHPDGFVYCEECGKPILRKYDMVLHHKKELDDLNVMDRNVSLNEDNIEILHFRCHNLRHNRFTSGHAPTYKPVQKHVYIVYGSPCSGKSTWVHEVATENDLIVDIDSIWEMISVNARYEKPAALRSVVFEMRDKMYDIIKYRNGKWHTAYVITGGALKGDRDRLKARLNADDAILIDTTLEECCKRAVHREGMNEEQQAKWLEYIDEWFKQYQPDTP